VSDTTKDPVAPAHDMSAPHTPINIGQAMGAASPRPTVRELIIQLTELQDDLRLPDQGWAQRRSLIDRQALVVRELRSRRMSASSDGTIWDPTDRGPRWGPSDQAAR